MEDTTLRGLHFQMSDSQRHRLKRAQEQLREAPGSYHSSAFVNIADPIHVQNEATVLKGHGTQVVDGQLMATLCGVVERVDQLITVKPLRSRYNADTGDVVVGRITEVGTKRWKVDINFRQDVHLMLSAVNLPGGIQRRRTVVDELNMRTLFEENDLISAEVQSVHSDGSVHLHTRSLKYGKLANGQLVRVPSYLIKRQKQHFHNLNSYGVDMIIGCNGYIWICAAPAAQTAAAELAGATGHSAASDAIGLHNETIPLKVRENICCFANSIRVLSALGFLIHLDSIIDTFDISTSMGLAIKDMLGAEFLVVIAEREAARRLQSNLV
ncbi:hypothetical protein GOP47_0027680 [Adiantum capillus-veneris]|nr:hypothetical protein GOP47_0027680 [Adiantum capillus-veneris]